MILILRQIFRSKERETRAQIQFELNSTKAKAEIVLSEPKQQNFELATEIEIFDLTENVRSAKIAAVSSLMSSPPTFTEEEIKKIEEAVQAEIHPQVSKIKMASRRKYLAANTDTQYEK